MDKLRIGSQLLRPGDTFWVQVQEAILRHAQQKNIEVIPLETAGVAIPNLHYDADTVCEEIAALRLDALLSLWLPDVLTMRLLNAGLPIVHLAETTINHPLAISPIGIYQSAYLIGQFLVNYVQQFPDRNFNLLVVGNLDDHTLEGERRYQGICNALQGVANLKFTMLSTGWNTDEATPLIEAWSLQYGAEHGRRFDAMCGLSDPLALCAFDICVRNGILDPHAFVAGINGDPLALAAIAAGRMAATVDLDPDLLAGQAIEGAIALAHGQGVSPYYQRQMKLVNAENINEVAIQKLIAIAHLPSQLIGKNYELEKHHVSRMSNRLEINRQLGTTLNKEMLLQLMIGLVQKYYDFTHTRFHLLDEQNNLISYGAVANHLRTQHELVSEAASEDDQRLLARVLTSKKWLIVPNGSPDQPDTYLAGGSRPAMRIVVPIHAAGVTLGLLDLSSVEPMDYRYHDLIDLQLLADHLGLALQNATLYEQALQAKALAERANHLKTRLLANVSHELRTPLNVASGYAQSVRRRLNPLDAATSVNELDHVLQSVQHLERLIDDLLDISRAEIGVLEISSELLDPGGLLADVFDDFCKSLTLIESSKAIEWRRCIPDRLPAVQGDPVRFRQILMNLLLNSYKFTAAGSIELGAEVASLYLHVWVKDTGGGIPEALQNVIFEPFVKGTDHDSAQQQPGVGLGLAITRHLVLLHGGSITFESSAEHGTVFHLYFPLPNLSGSLIEARNDSPTCLLVIASSADISKEIRHVAELNQWTVHPWDTTTNNVPLDVQPAAIAWDFSSAQPGDWTVLQRIRQDPHLSKLPLFAYGIHDRKVSLAGVLIKPVRHTTLLHTIQSLHTDHQRGAFLIVDDDQPSCELMRNLLLNTYPAATIMVAHSGEQALEILAEQRICLTILDLFMPGMDGFSVLNAMRHKDDTRWIPVIILSGQVLSLQDLTKLDYNNVIFLSKNVMPDESIADMIARSLNDPSPVSYFASLMVKHTLVSLQNDYAHHLTRGGIAEKIGVSEDYLSDIFKKEMGVSLWEYLNRYRVEQAKKLLRATNKSISAIAAEVGLDDQSYFGRVFRKYAGCTPRQYREQPPT